MVRRARTTSFLGRARITCMHSLCTIITGRESPRARTRTFPRKECVCVLCACLRNVTRGDAFRPARACTHTIRRFRDLAIRRKTRANARRVHPHRVESRVYYMQSVRGWMMMMGHHRARVCACVCAQTPGVCAKWVDILTMRAWAFASWSRGRRTSCAHVTPASSDSMSFASVIFTLNGALSRISPSNCGHQKGVLSECAYE